MLSFHSLRIARIVLCVGFFNESLALAQTGNAGRWEMAQAAQPQLALGAPRSLGMVTPFGGLAFIAGWVCFALAVIFARTPA